MDCCAAHNALTGRGGSTHDLRHHCASVLISSGVSIKSVQRYLGHKNASETLDTYGHLMPGDDDRLRSAIDVALRGNVHRVFRGCRPLIHFPWSGVGAMVRQPPCPRRRVGVLLGPARPGERSDLSPTKDRSDDIGKNARSEFPMVSRSGRSRWLSWRRRSWRMTFVVEERTAEGGIKVRTVATDESATIDIIADRMRLTLVEVLDGARADAMFRRNELVDRVRWHLERSDPDR
jgi:hypothetical protein